MFTGETVPRGEGGDSSPTPNENGPLQSARTIRELFDKSWIVSFNDVKSELNSQPRLVDHLAIQHSPNLEQLHSGKTRTVSSRS
jgi:hypothetical protein